MHKVILVILATVVNELAAAHDESKLVDNCTFFTVNQGSSKYEVMPEILTVASFYSEKGVRYVPLVFEPSWKLFANFKPGTIHCVDYVGMNPLDGVKMGYK